MVGNVAIVLSEISAKSVGERFSKIGQHLTKLEPIILCGRFSRHQLHLPVWGWGRISHDFRNGGSFFLHSTEARKERENMGWSLLSSLKRLDATSQHGVERFNI